jgi:hypothetical protein
MRRLTLIYYMSLMMPDHIKWCRFRSSIIMWSSTSALWNALIESSERLRRASRRGDLAQQAHESKHSIVWPFKPPVFLSFEKKSVISSWFLDALLLINSYARLWVSHLSVLSMMRDLSYKYYKWLDFFSSIDSYYNRL